MDTSISLVTPAMNRQRGADAFDEGRGIDDHHMNPGEPAIKDWQFGWHTRRIEKSQAARRKSAAQQLEACPP